MYIPRHYNDSTVEEVREFIAANGFGILINTMQGRLWATHIPMEMSVNDRGEDVLPGHIAKANNQWRSFEAGSEVLAVFHGPHAYVSSAWYTHENVPTWNYIAVHVYGTIAIIEGEKLYHALQQLITKYEAQTKTYLSLDALPEKMVRREIRGIVGFEITIKEVQAAFKLSQNKDDESYANVISRLEASGNRHDTALSACMKGRRKDRF